MRIRVRVPVTCTYACTYKPRGLRGPRPVSAPAPPPGWLAVPGRRRPTAGAVLAVGAAVVPFWPGSGRGCRAPA
eukprot:10099009-Lingulodinium_polyedra.AAC.1